MIIYTLYTANVSTLSAQFGEKVFLLNYIPQGFELQ